MRNEIQQGLQVPKEFVHFKDVYDLGMIEAKYYRSNNGHDTAIYFTEVPDSKRNTAEAFFELIILENPLPNYFIRYPNTDYFIKLFGNGSGSGRGLMQHKTGLVNIWENQFKRSISIYQHQPDLLILIGDVLPEFNFMHMIAHYKSEDGEIIMKYPFVKLPDNIRRIEYLFKDDSSVKFTTYIVVDLPAFDYQYSNFRLRTLTIDHTTNEIEEPEIINDYTLKNVVRARDGGTTEITVLDNKGNEHKLFSPTPLQQSAKATWDGIVLSDYNIEICAEGEDISDISSSREYVLKTLGITEMPEYLKKHF